MGRFTSVLVFVISIPSRGISLMSVVGELYGSVGEKGLGLVLNVQV